MKVCSYLSLWQCTPPLHFYELFFSIAGGSVLILMGCSKLKLENFLVKSQFFGIVLKKVQKVQPQWSPQLFNLRWMAILVSKGFGPALGSSPCHRKVPKYLFFSTSCLPLINTAIRSNQDAIKITTNIVELQSFHTLGHEIGTIKRSVWYFWHQPQQQRGL